LEPKWHIQPVKLSDASSFEKDMQTAFTAVIETVRGESKNPTFASYFAKPASAPVAVSVKPPVAFSVPTKSPVKPPVAAPTKTSVKPPVAKPVALDLDTFGGRMPVRLHPSIMAAPVLERDSDPMPEQTAIPMQPMHDPTFGGRMPVGGWNGPVPSFPMKKAKAPEPVDMKKKKK